MLQMFLQHDQMVCPSAQSHLDLATYTFCLSSLTNVWHKCSMILQYIESQLCCSCVVHCKAFDGMPLHYNVFKYHHCELVRQEAQSQRPHIASQQRFVMSVLRCCALFHPVLCCYSLEDYTSILAAAFVDCKPLCLSRWCAPHLRCKCCTPHIRSRTMGKHFQFQYILMRRSHANMWTTLVLLQAWSRPPTT